MKTETYEVRYQTKRGGSGLMQTSSYDKAFRKLMSCYNQRVECTVKRGEFIAGRVWKEGKWLWFFEKKANYNIALEGNNIVKT